MVAYRRMRRRRRADSSPSCVGGCRQSMQSTTTAVLGARRLYPRPPSSSSSVIGAVWHLRSPRATGLRSFAPHARLPPPPSLLPDSEELLLSYEHHGCTLPTPITIATFYASSSEPRNPNRPSHRRSYCTAPKLFLPNPRRAILVHVVRDPHL
jgi:hypothetical protein